MPSQENRSQRSLFEADQADFSFEEYAPKPPAPPTRAEEQLKLFEGMAPLIGELEAALREADFGTAIRVRRKLEEEYGELKTVPGEFPLDEFGADFWERGAAPAEQLATWNRFAVSLGRGTPRHKVVRKAFFERLFSQHNAAEVSRSHPDMIPEIANALYSSDRTSEAREIVRDALLAGHLWRPRDFEDPELADILGEDYDERWLASLGAIRGLWPRTQLDENEIEELEQRLSDPDPEDDSERAISFWSCLCLARAGTSVSELAVHEARKRMKRLNQELHAEFMRKSFAR